ncbi:hypothetical protein MXAN_0999 [Myxococcus xanthus DK 1622]|uniref:Uncharacterized protein n=1 Tax=Myxococcus xanthus (strain DK1622) TaxID=246197 RepID=Q1DDL3_MYXXD|nr:hypothetical protein MXAN_0999 [Myxococcus xanthus DK 1622]
MDTWPQFPIPTGQRQRHRASTLSLMQRLKSETRPHHERTETQVRLMDADLTPTAYRRHLEALHGFYVPLEARLAGLGLEAGTCLRLRLTSTWGGAFGRPPTDCFVDALIQRVTGRRARCHAA